MITETTQDVVSSNRGSSPYLTNQEACQFMRIGRTKLSELLSSGTLHCSRKLGKILINKKDCYAFIEFGKSAWRYLTKGQKQIIGDSYA